MGSKSQKQKVYDFLMSLDYGLCHGPIDHVNMVWIKDKPILCDVIDRRTDYEIWLPELFGGDTAEGGVGGTLEVYMGSDEQFSSSELSSRDGRNVVDMPGYRGLCHLFFRGFRTEAATAQIDQQWGSGLNLLQTTLRRFFVGDVDGLKTANTMGWKWGSNNPYTPKMKASATRLPTMPNPAYKSIWPLGAEFGSTGDVTDLTPRPLSIIRDDNGVGVDLTATGTIIDLIELGATQEQIDAGEVLLRINASATLRTWNTNASAIIENGVRFYANVPTSWDQTSGEIAPVSGEEDQATSSEIFSLSTPVPNGYTGYGETEINTITAPVGSRYVQIMSSYNGNETYRVNSAGTYIVAIDEPLDPVDEPEPITYPPEDAYRTVLNEGFAMQALTPWRLGNVVDLLAIGLTEEQIDAGLTRIATIVIRENDEQGIPALVGIGDANVYQVNSFHAVEPINYYDATVLPGWGVEGDPTPGVEVEFDIGSPLGPIETNSAAIPPGTRFVQVRGGYDAAVGRSTSFRTAQFKILVADGESTEPIWCQPDQELGPLPDANPAHIIYEAMTNDDWGKGESEALMNSAAFESAAEVLFNERMGISIGWFQQETIENFIGEILDHIQAFLFQDPSTGLWELKLLRDDYDLVDAHVLNETNCQATNRKRRLWGQTINEIVVSYTDPITEKPATVSAHNLANIQIQGGINSETRDYHGFRNPNLAQLVAERDVAESGYPLFSCELEVDREFWNARPGDIAVFSWPEDGIDQIVLRVMSVDYGSTKDRTIKINASEDIFSVDKATYSAPQTTNWTNQGAGTGSPTPLEAQAAITVPLPMILRNGYTTEEVDERYPNVPGALLGDDDDLRPTKIQVQSRVTNATGSSGYEKIADVSVALSGRISAAWAQEEETLVSDIVISGINRAAARPGSFFMLGLSELESELVMLVSLNEGTGYWTVARGMWDTVPRTWPVGTRIWSFSLGESNLDPVERSAGESVTYAMLPVTGFGVLARGLSTPLEVTYTARPHAPFRPSDAQIEGNGFGSFIVTEEPYPTEINVSWKNRNRETEDVVAMRWGEDSVGVEAGQTTVLRILNTDGSEHGEIVDLTGETHTIAAALLPPAGAGYIEFLSERDGIRSIMGARRYFQTETPDIGYGNSYGIAYGGVLAEPAP